VLVQLIRNAPNDFNPKVIEAHADDDQMLATRTAPRRLAVGPRAPHPEHAGRAVFQRQDQTCRAHVDPDAARLDELARGLDMQWTGGERAAREWAAS
jgi:hypothetical protein